MKKVSFILTLAITLCAAAAPFVPGKVKVDDFLNVRKGPGLRHPVMGRLLSGTEVKILRVCDNWLELQAPEQLAIYISEARVNPDGTLNGELNMRTRKDTAAPSFGILPAGTKVKRLDDRSNGWVKIVPPETVKVYVAALCVQFDRQAFDNNGLPIVKAVENTAETPADAPTAEKAPAVSDEPAAPAAEKTPAAPAASAESKQISLRGIPVKWEYSKTPETAYALLDSPNGKNQAFIIFSDQTKVDALLNKNVEVSGSCKIYADTGIKVVTVTEIKEIK